MYSIFCVKFIYKRILYKYIIMKSNEIMIENLLPKKIIKNVEVKTVEVKKSSGRPKKADKYKKEREEVLIKLNNILGVTNDNQKICICNINEEKQKKIMALKGDVEKYFTSKDKYLFIRETME